MSVNDRIDDTVQGADPGEVCTHVMALLASAIALVVVCGGVCVCERGCSGQRGGEV
jgi:hypothetical protein